MRPGLRPNWAVALSNDRIAEDKRLFVKIAREICPAWKVAPEHREVINAIFEWCMDIPGNLDLEKGLWLWGNNGTGKTTLLHIVKRFCARIGKRDSCGDVYGFRIVNTSEICGAYERDGRGGIEKYIVSRRQAFDELGSEEIPTGHFGTPLNVMQYILQGRYDRRFGDFTHVTTNLTLDDVMRRYEARIYDRCKEMFNLIHLGGKTYRQKPYGWTND